MNNSKMWLVVKPTVGVPLFLSAVAIGSFAVHVAVLTNTSWVSDFLSGVPMGTGDQTAALERDAATAQASFDAQAMDGQAILVTLPDGTTARAVIELPKALAAAQSGTLPDG
ncbi:light-harvesting protein [Aestuariivita sp.]|jgi:light-harvesting protein B-800-850 alpha chain|uniref:light-harvesting protein n=1 Tax=Aestuariivita sp. TaxID=1872407 RepID=UPI0021731BC2|nr:light-harvesting protein [Aestuariivita sp.]MCE8006223.1 light-harvesting protein [Aestuariivita sp.]